jgi:hypothetical protein
MKLEWSKWNVGGKIIFVASCVAVVSMFMNWVDLGITARIGISQAAFLLLGFWIYPVYMLLNNRSIKLRWGLPSATLSIAGVIAYIASKSMTIAGQSGNFSAIGAWMFLIASVALIIGVALSRPIRVTIDPGKWIKLKTESGKEGVRKLNFIAKILVSCAIFSFIASVVSPLSRLSSDNSIVETIVINLISYSVIFLLIGLIPLLIAFLLAMRQATVERKIKRLNWGIIITWIISFSLVLMIAAGKYM